MGPVVASNEVQWDWSDMSVGADDLVLQGDCLRIRRCNWRGMVACSLRLQMREQEKDSVSNSSGAFNM